jgi:demethylmenaquinone methyltransferase/2-methoxy-6-polyprenyl-1,4-benzoquinol methylase
VLLTQSRSIHCVDAAPEVVEISRRRLAGYGRQPTYEVANVFKWRAPRRFNTVFLGFWLSHVPDGEFVAFWNLVDEGLSAGGQVLVVDSLPEPTSTAVDQVLERTGEVTRRLNDGREFRIVKQFWEPQALAERLRTIGWQADLRTTATYLLYGSLTRVL